MQFSPLRCYLVPLRPKYSPQRHILKHSQPMFLSECERPSFKPIKNNTVYINLYIFGQQIKAKPSPKNCDSIFKLLFITECQLERIALQRPILEVVGSITVCEANCPCRRFCIPPRVVQSNVYSRTLAVTPAACCPTLPFNIVLKIDALINTLLD